MTETAKQGLRRLAAQAQQHMCAEADELLATLRQKSVFFYADPFSDDGSIDFSPLHRFGDVHLFIYAGKESTQADVIEAISHMESRTLVGDQLRAESILQRLKWDGREEHCSLRTVLRAQPGLTAPAWAVLTPITRIVVNQPRRFLLLCIGSSPEIEYRRLFTVNGAAPKYLCFSASGVAHSQRQHFLWSSPLALAVQENAAAEPQFVVTDDFDACGRAHWPWSAKWTAFNTWNGVCSYALLSHIQAQVAPASTSGSRAVAVRHGLLTPATVGGAEAVLIGPELHREHRWPDNVRLLVNWSDHYDPDARTLRLNPTFRVVLLRGLPLADALARLDGVCAALNVCKVAIAGNFGFEDEGAELEKWRMMDSGVVRDITFHLPLIGNVQSFGPFADTVL